MTDNAKVIAILKNIIAAIEENAQFLTDLDAAIGDNDHGINMARGFKKVDADLPGLEGKDIGAILKRSAWTWSPPWAAPPDLSTAPRS